MKLVKPGDKPDGKDGLPNDADANGLWNGQPFRQPPAVPIPDCPAGCARAQPVLVPPLPPPLASSSPPRNPPPSSRLSRATLPP